MPVDRELRSSKRQRIEQIGTLDVSIVKSDSSEPVTNCKRPKMDSELSNMRISDGKTHKHIENMDSAKESEKISPEASEDNIRQLSCKSGANERDSTKDTMMHLLLKRTGTREVMKPLANCFLSKMRSLPVPCYH